MFNAHVVNTTLRPGLQEGLLFRIVDLINGLVAPVFLLTAGLVFALATPPSSTDRIATVKGWGKQLLLIWVIGYLLRAPGLMPESWHHAGAQDWDRFLKVDILHCIALSWVVLLSAYVTIRSAATRRRVLGGLCIGIVAATPVLWSVSFPSVIPVALANYVTAEYESLFPFFPWGAYVLAGTVAGRALISADRRNVARQHMRRLLLVGGVGGLSLGLLAFNGHRLWPGVGWDGDPVVIAAYLLLSLATMALFYLALEPTQSGQAQPQDPGWLEIVGQESLLLYVAHLLVLYRLGWNEHTLASTFGNALGPWGVIALFIALSIAMAGLALGWQRTKENRSLRVWVQVIGLTIAAYALA